MTINSNYLDSPPKIETGHPEISMAPLVDIVFLLLIFFMVTTVFPENDGLIIEKPRSENSAQLARENLIIQIDQAGLSYIKQKLVTLEDIERILRDALLLKPNLSVIVHADRRTTTAALVSVIDAAKAGGAKQLGIATEEKDG